MRCSFSGSWGPWVALTWLLAACVFFGLSPGAHGILCQRCTMEKPGMPCYPVDSFCRAAHGGCFIEREFKNAKLMKITKDCYTDNDRCETKWINSKDGIEHEKRCCTKEDNCNQKL